MSRRFMKSGNIRQVADVYGIQDVRSVSECSVMCNVRVKKCIGFNFKQVPPSMYELSRITHDAPNA